MKAPIRATVLGAGGFVGGHLVRSLKRAGWDVLALGRGDQTWREQPMGHVFYCIGLTADFRTRPFETIEAHVSLAAEVLRTGVYDSFLYCSSTRVYAGCAEAAESARLSVNPNDPSDLYNLSKLMGEAACLAVDRPQVRVARLSNVFGPGDQSDNFLTSVLREAVATGGVIMRSPPASAKDYVAVTDVAEALTRIALDGTERIYNVAAGVNTTHGELLAAIQAQTGCEIVWPVDNTPQIFPPIRVQRLNSLGVQPRRSILDQVANLLEQAKNT